MDTDDKLEADLLAQNELFRLNRQYRIMEGDRSTFHEEANIKLAKQRKIINILKKERENLLTDLKVASSQINQRKDHELTKKLNLLLKQHEELSRNILERKGHLSEIALQIRKIDKKMFILKSRDITDLHWQQMKSESRNIIKSLENRLSVAVNKYCAILAENQKLREEIDHVLKERKRFHNVLDKLSNDLREKKKFSMDLIEQAILAYDQREEWGSKLHEMRCRVQNEIVIHTQEMRELQRKLDYDLRLKEFLAIKGQRRVMKNLEEKIRQKKEQEKEEKEKEIANYKDILEKIQEFVGEKEVNKLIKHYVKQEEENFALFNYVNELNHELESLTENLTELNNNLEEQKALNVERARQQKDTVDSLKIQLETTTSEADNQQIVLNQVEEELKSLLNGIGELFNFLKCDIAPVIDLLGDNSTINDSNVMLFLGLLDKKISELNKIIIYKEAVLERKTRATLNLLRRNECVIVNTAHEI